MRYHFWFATDCTEAFTPGTLRMLTKINNICRRFSSLAPGCGEVSAIFGSDYHVETQRDHNTLVVIDLQEGILPFAGGLARIRRQNEAAHAPPPAGGKSVVPARPCGYGTRRMV